MKSKSLILAFCFVAVTNLPGTVCAQVNVQDSLALVDLYNGTNGPGWPYQDNWLTASPVSTWFGITVSNTRVTEINLFADFLQGSIPPSLGKIEKLRLLNLSFNQLNGSMPSSLGNLTDLYTLDLSSNQLSGSIPPSLGNLTNLYTLNLSVNQLNGSIPSKLGNLINLSELDLLNNQLSGNIPPQLGELINLSSLYLYNNQLSGNIPASLGNLANLTAFYLYNNKLSGSIPVTLGNLTKLTYLYLNNNQLTGSIPATLGNLTKLYWLYLNDNQLSGDIPPQLGNLAYLNYLDLSGNQLSGGIPASLGNLKNMEILDLSANHLSGGIPVTLGKLKYLYELNVSGNKLSGHIGSVFGNLKNLSRLYIDHNKLTGDVSPLATLNLYVLNLSYNRFTFDGMENVVRKFPFAIYDHQKIIPVHSDKNALSVSAGGTLSNNTYRWYRLGQAGYTQITGDSVFHPGQNGIYYAKVGNSIATDLILKSDTISYNTSFAFNEKINDISANEVKAENKDSRFFVYPNPAKNLLYVQTTGYSSFSLISGEGKLLLTKSINGKGNIDISGMAAGLYYLRKNSSGEERKIIIAK